MALGEGDLRPSDNAAVAVSWRRRCEAGLFLSVLFLERWTFCGLDSAGSSDWLQADGHPPSATSDCNQEVYAQTSGSWWGLVRSAVFHQPGTGGQASGPRRTAASPGLLRHRLNSEPAHFQCPGEVGPAGATAPGAGRPQLRPAADPQPCAGAVHACSAQGSRLCLWTPAAGFLPSVSWQIPRSEPPGGSSGGRLHAQETRSGPGPAVPTCRAQEDLHH